MNKLHFLRAVWSDIILVESNGLYGLIDTGFARAFPRIKDYLDRLGVKRLEFILITHFHKDHYGSLPALLQTYPVGTVYMKKFSGLNITDGSGHSASDEFNAREMENCERMCALARYHSRLVVLDGTVGHVKLGEFDFQLFGEPDAIRIMYLDPFSPYYHQIRFGENTNSVVLYANVNGTHIYLGGDACNEPLEYERYSCQNTRYACEINHRIDLLKVPHHCCGNVLSEQFLEILQPRYCIATNFTATVNGQMKANRDKLLASTPETQLLVTDVCGYCFTIGANGDLSFEEFDRLPPITFEEIPPERSDEFWPLHIRYLVEDDIISDPEDIEYFRSNKYRFEILKHMSSTHDRHHLVYMIRDGKRIGAASYSISEDSGECFLYDFWVFKPFRGDGLGHHCYMALESYTQSQGAEYHEINCTGKDRTRFWKALGFVDDGLDEWNVPLLRKNRMEYKTYGGNPFEL